MPDKFPDVDSYIDSFPSEVQDVLQKIRRTIHEAVPDSTETISYNIPTMLRDGRRYVHFSGWARHVSLYPTPESSAGLAEELEPLHRGQGHAQVHAEQADSLRADRPGRRRPRRPRPALGSKSRPAPFVEET